MWAGGSVWYGRRLRNSSSMGSFDEQSVDWESFEVFLEDKCSERVAKDRLRYARKFYSCLFKGDFSELAKFSDSKRCHVMNALSNLAKFLGIYEEFKGLVKRYGLTWKSGKTGV